MQLLVLVVDKTSPDPARNIQLEKRGDVIAVRRPDESWGLNELLGADWRIISVPDMTEDEANSFLAPELEPIGKPDAPVMKRIFKFNIDSYVDKSTVDAPRTATYDKDQLVVPDVQAVKSDVLAVKIMKPASKDPSIIGPVDSPVIGPA